MSLAREQVFIRKASGLTRQISAWDALMYCSMNPGLLWPFIYMWWGTYAYPGAHMTWATLGVLVIVPIAALYWLFSVAMPRSGGEYVYVSRTLHPTLGLVVSWTLSIILLFWSGQIINWAVRWGLIYMLKGVSMINGNTVLSGLADMLNQPLPRAILGTVLMVLLFYILIRGAKWVMRLSWIAVLSSLATIVVFGIAAAISGHGQFAANFQQMTGISVDSVVQAAQSAGFPLAPTAVMTIMAAFTYVGLNTLGSTLSANVAGEIRGVQKSQALALFGSLVVIMVMWAAVYAVMYGTWGYKFVNALAWAYSTGASVYPLSGYEPFPVILVAYMVQNPIFPVLLGIGWMICAFAVPVGVAYGATRNMFAWAFDRMIPPSWTEIGTKYRAPWRVILVATIIAELFLLMDVYFPSWTALSGFSIMSWFLAWAILGVAAIVFPFRRRDLYDAAPAIVRSRFLGVPVITLLGVFMTLANLATVWFILNPFFRGVLPFTIIVVTLVIMVLPVLLWVFSTWYYGRRGIPVHLQFQQVPPE